MHGLFTFQIYNPQESRCYYSYMDSAADLELDFTELVKQQCNGKQSCVNLLDWDTVEKLFNNDVYGGNLYIDAFYSCTG